MSWHKCYCHAGATLVWRISTLEGNSGSACETGLLFHGTGNPSVIPNLLSEIIATFVLVFVVERFSKRWRAMGWLAESVHT
jgi:glycerol uptake facilitator-like aquaporin